MFLHNLVLQHLLSQKLRDATLASLGNFFNLQSSVTPNLACEYFEI